MTPLQDPYFSMLVLLARVCLSTLFLVSGIHKALWYPRAFQEFTESSVPMVGVTLPLVIVLHLLASICILLGVFVTPAALSLAVFLIGATVLVHTFWSQSPERLIQSRNAAANLAIIGGLLLLVGTGPGKYTLF